MGELGNIIKKESTATNHNVAMIEELTILPPPMAVVDPDGQVDAAAVVAELLQQQQQQQHQQQEQQQLSQQPLQPRTIPPLPEPLPAGWVLKESRSQPNHYYYYNQETGYSTWESPIPRDNSHAATTGIVPDLLAVLNDIRDSATAAPTVPEATAYPPGDDPTHPHSNLDTAASATTSKHGDSGGDGLNAESESSVARRKRPRMGTLNDGIEATTEETISLGGGRGRPQPPSKQSRTKPSASTTATSTASVPTMKVRVLHILKKHAASRRPSSWRVPNITISKEEAREEIQALLDILHEVQDNPEELRATFEELARTESDCSSAKRGGDLGFFGPKKMQPPFEHASFALAIGQLSEIVESSSGVHIILRIG